MCETLIEYRCENRQLKLMSKQNKQMQMRYEQKKTIYTDEQIIIIVGKIGVCHSTTKSIFLDSSSANNSFCFSISILLHVGCPLIKLLPFKQ